MVKPILEEIKEVRTEEKESQEVKVALETKGRKTKRGRLKGKKLKMSIHIACSSV